MNFLKIKLLVIAVIMFAASSAFATLEYAVSVDTASLAGTNGYLYFQYNTGISQVGTTTATVQNFNTDGVLGAQVAGAFQNSGNYVAGTLPGIVSFTNGNIETNDYNQAITFGSMVDFNLVLPNGNPNNDSSDFSFWLTQDAGGSTPLLTASGELFDITLNANGTATSNVIDASTTNVAPVPEPGTCALLGAGLFGLCVYGKRRKML
jgi:hypothetical protein